MLLVVGRLLLILSSVTAGAEGETSGGQLVFLGVSRRESAPAVVAVGAEVRTLLVVADELAVELDGEMPVELRRELCDRLGKLIARAWAAEIPHPKAPAGPALGRLMVESERGNRAARSGLRFVVDALMAHAGRAVGDGDLLTIERALLWLGRINGPLATTALYTLSRGAAEPGARRAAVGLLGELAQKHSPDRFAEACARVLLE